LKKTQLELIARNWKRPTFQNSTQIKKCYSKIAKLYRFKIGFVWLMTSKDKLSKLKESPTWLCRANNFGDFWTDRPMFKREFQFRLESQAKAGTVV